jgi:sugar lactone lactonase YvrE
VLKAICDPEADKPHNRMNDGKCDAAGRFWCGSMNPESGRAEGSLHVLDTDLACKRTADGWLTPNGIAWSVDARTMYVADTRRGAIYAFAFDMAKGALGERRVFADLGALPGGPDGATVDNEGFLWSAQFDGGCLIRYRPDGQMDRVVRLPVSKPTSCAFGGPGYRQLYVTTAMRGLSEEQRKYEPLAGRVLVLDVGAAGLAPQVFGGCAK